jgi:hypothetical protein
MNNLIFDVSFTKIPETGCKYRYKHFPVSVCPTSESLGVALHQSFAEFILCRFVHSCFNNFLFAIPISFHSTAALILFLSSYLHVVSLDISVVWFGLEAVLSYSAALFCSYIHQLASDMTKLATCFSQHVLLHHTRKLHPLVKRNCCKLYLPLLAPRLRFCKRSHLLNSPLQKRRTRHIEFREVSRRTGGDACSRYDLAHPLPLSPASERDSIN